MVQISLVGKSSGLTAVWCSGLCRVREVKTRNIWSNLPFFRTQPGIFWIQILCRAMHSICYVDVGVMQRRWERGGGFLFEKAFNLSESAYEEVWESGENNVIFALFYETS